MSKRKNLLMSLLRPIAQEWTKKEIELALVEIWGELSASCDISCDVPRIISKKITASEQVLRSKVSGKHRQIILELAGRFDRKEFLPSISDVKELLIMMGYHDVMIRDRSDSFRRLLRVFQELPLDQLKRIADSPRHSGPSKLGPLSDAISSAAASIPRLRPPEND